MLVVAATIGASGPAAAAGISVTVTPQTGRPIQLLTCTSQKTRVEIAGAYQLTDFNRGNVQEHIPKSGEASDIQVHDARCHRR